MGDGASPLDADPQRERFSNGITDLYVTIEDLRQSLRFIEKTTDPNDISYAIAAERSGRISVDLLQEWQRLMDRMVQITDFLLQFVPKLGNATTGSATVEEMEMLQHTIGKASDSTKHVLHLCCSQYSEPTQESLPVDDSLAPMEEQRRIGQAAVARIAEMNIIIAFHSLQLSTTPLSRMDCTVDTKESNVSDASMYQCMEDIVQQYVQFQRRTFRLRCKPAIAQLVDLRGQQKVFAPPERDTSLNGLSTYNEETEEILRRTEREQRLALLLKQYHAPVFTTVLGNAAALMHPLAAWMAHVVPSADVPKSLEYTIPSFIQRLCSQSISVIHEQTEALVKSVSEWFYVDRKYIFDMSSSLEDPILRASNSNQTMSLDQQVGLLTAVVDEMAYIAQILERYRSLVDSCSSNTGGFLSSKSNLITNSILPEWIWQYSALERQLVVHQWQMSVLPTDEYSCYAKDAQYITERAMERAVSTQSLHAMGTIAYAITRDIWAAESAEEETSKSAMTVYRALCKEIGCWSEPKVSLNKDIDSKRIANVASPSSGSGFATALLDALDEEMDHPPTAASARSPGSNTDSPSKPPRSGGTSFLSSLISSSAIGAGSEWSEQRQLDTLFCVCNSLHAAAGACRNLVNTLDEILLDNEDLLFLSGSSNVKTNGDPSSELCNSRVATEYSPTPSEATKKAVSLIHLARDELLRYSGQYQELLSVRAGESVHLWCYSGNGGVSSGRSRLGCLDVLQDFFTSESYDINGSTFTDLEADERLENRMLLPLKQSPLLHQMVHKCETPIIQIFSERIATVVIDMLLDFLWTVEGIGAMDVDNEKNHLGNQSVQKRFTDWGALLLSKQSRMLQHYISVTMTQQNVGYSASTGSSNGSAAAMATSMAVLQIWDRLSQVVTILQLEKPIDWLIYHATSKLTPDEVSRTMRLRVDFSNDAIEKVVADIREKPAFTTSSIKT